MEQSFETGRLIGNISFGGAVCTYGHNVKEATQIFHPKMIKKVEFYPPAVKVTFCNGTVTTAVAQEGDEYDAEQGIAMCILDYIFGGKTYNNLFRKYIKQDEEAKKAVIKVEEEKQERKEIEARQAEKARRRKAAKAEREKERQIEIQKEAYIRAMKEMAD